MTPWDVFISHASDDKEAFVDPLARRLRQLTVRVWYDKFVLAEYVNDFETPCVRI
jgi:hypothetical protein